MTAVLQLFFCCAVLTCALCCYYRLLNDLIESQKSYQILLKTSLEEQKLHLQLLTQTAQQMRLFGQLLTLAPSSIMRSSDTGFSSHHTINSEDDLASQGGSSAVIEVPEVASIVTSNENSSSQGACCHLGHTHVSHMSLNIRDPKLIDFLTELHLDRSSIEKVYVYLAACTSYSAYRT